MMQIPDTVFIGLCGTKDEPRIFGAHKLSVDCSDYIFGIQGFNILSSFSSFSPKQVTEPCCIRSDDPAFSKLPTLSDIENSSPFKEFSGEPLSSITSYHISVLVDPIVLVQIIFLP